MRTSIPTHKSDAIVLRDLKSLVVQGCANTADVVAHIAEAEERRLFLPAGYPSMYEYCVRELRLSEDAAFKRIRAARAAREFPKILDALASGRLHLSAVVLLKPCLTPDNADDLIAAATHRTKTEIEQLLACRFPKDDVPERIVPITPRAAGMTSAALLVAGPVVSGASELVPGPVAPGASQLVPGPVASGPSELVPGPVEFTATRPGSSPVQSPAPRPRVTPLAPERFAIQFTISKDTHDKLRHVQELLSHRLPSGDVAQVFDRALDTLIAQLEKRKFAATDRPRPRSHSSANPRYIPAHVKRAVCERDQGRCTFVSETGQRCGARKFLQYDHVEPVARGGQATVNGIRLRCQGHNQYEADCALGAAFMNRKREQARRDATSEGPRDTASSGLRTDPATLESEELHVT